MIDVIGKRRLFVGLSLALVLLSVIALVYPGLKIGIDFSSGSSVTVRFTGVNPESADVQEAFTAAGHSEAVVQDTGGNEFFVRTADLGATGIDDIEAELDSRYPDGYTIVEVSTVGAAVAREAVRTSVIAVIVGSVFVMAYIMYSFRTVPASYRYAIASVVPLVHDVVITMGVFALLGELIEAEVNAIFVVGVLTLIGYTVNNTIVVFDRVRENVRLFPSRPFRQSVNLAINETLTRNLNVSITTLLAVAAMLVLGGDTLRDFMIVLFVGIGVGLYSSTFIASQLLVAWESGELGRMLRFPFRRKQANPAQTA